VTGHGRRDVLRYSCGHIYEPDTFAWHGMVPAGASVKDILADCRHCRRPIKRLPPGLAQRVAEEEWV
jgi:hypothetical protein